jgi:hypothetical protein
MPHEKIEKRDSHALEPQLTTEPTAKAEAEARNVLRQYDAGLAVVQNALEHGSFKLRPSLILALHREALSGISIFAGNYRPGGVEIQGSRHEPVGAHLVPELVEGSCDYVCLRHVCMDHRIKFGGDESESVVTVAFHSSGAKSYRENEILFFLSPRAGRGRIAQQSG